jgi:acyl-coenzyme A thioesterase PaaI-like protein
LLNLEFVRTIDKRYEFSVCFPKESENIYGGVQGGMISSAIDEATFVAILMTNNSIKQVSSTNHHVIFHRQVYTGKNLIEVSFKKIGKRVLNVEGNLFLPDGNLATTLIHSASILRNKGEQNEVQG